MSEQSEMVSEVPPPPLEEVSTGSRDETARDVNRDSMYIVV